jgi:hypothetical protein
MIGSFGENANASVAANGETIARLNFGIGKRSTRPLIAGRRKRSSSTRGIETTLVCRFIQFKELNVADNGRITRQEIANRTIERLKQHAKTTERRMVDNRFRQKMTQRRGR